MQPPSDRNLITAISYSIFFIIILELAYHHSGITIDEKSYIEDAYKGKSINILFCTTTLAAGVNLPANTVIITSTKLGNENLSSLDYKQMIGRAGRLGYSSSGESYIMCYKSSLYILY